MGFHALNNAPISPAFKANNALISPGRVHTTQLALLFPPTDSRENASQGKYALICPGPSGIALLFPPTDLGHFEITLSFPPAMSSREEHFAPISPGLPRLGILAKADSPVCLFRFGPGPETSLDCLR